MVAQLIIIGNGFVIYTHNADFNIGKAAVNGNALWGVLKEVVCFGINIRLASFAIDIQLHQSAIGSLTHDKRHLQPLLRGELHTDTDIGDYLVAVLIGYGLCRACVHRGFLRCNLESLWSRHTGNDISLSVNHVRNLELHFNGAAR